MRPNHFGLRIVCFTLAMVFVLAIGGAVRFAHLSEPLWIDERHSQWVVAADLIEVPGRAAAGNQPPLYFLLLDVVVAIGGDSPAVLRSPSLFAAAWLSLGLPLLLFRVTGKVSAGLVAAVFLAFDPDLIFYSIEARPYAWIVLLAPLQAAAVAARFGLAGLGSPQRPSPRVRWAAIVATVALIWIHYTALVLVVAEGILLIVQTQLDPQRRRERWRNDHRSRQVAIDLAVIGVLIAPLLATLSRIVAHRADWGAFVTGDAAQAAPLLGLGVWGIAIPALMIGVERAVRLRWTRPREVNHARTGTASDESALRPFDTIGVAIFFGGSAVVAWGIAAAATHWAGTPILLDRYLIGTWSWVAIAAAMLIASLRNEWFRPLVALGLAGWCVAGPETRAWYDTGHWPVHRIEPWAEVVRELESPELNQRGVLLYAGLIEESRLIAEASPADLEYLRFPLIGLADPQRIDPQASFPAATWPEGIGSKIDADGGIAIVVRDDPSSANIVMAVTERLAKTLRQLPGRFTIDVESSGAIFLITARRLSGTE